HGTHVTGIIGAERNNGIGIDGVANAVKLMILRVVPDGD
ncbi:S8 family serine peptidase, partial [Klebsiella oxytoca]